MYVYRLWNSWRLGVIRKRTGTPLHHTEGTTQVSMQSTTLTSGLAQQLLLMLLSAPS